MRSWQGPRRAQARGGLTCREGVEPRVEAAHSEAPRFGESTLCPMSTFLSISASAAAIMHVGTRQGEAHRFDSRTFLHRRLVGKVEVGFGLVPAAQVRIEAPDDPLTGFTETSNIDDYVRITADGGIGTVFLDADGLGTTEGFEVLGTLSTLDLSVNDTVALLVADPGITKFVEVLPDGSVV